MRYLALVLVASCAARQPSSIQYESQPVHTREELGGSPTFTIKETPPVDNTPSPQCAVRREEREKAIAELEGAKAERKEWFAKHCKRQIPNETSIRLRDGARFSRPSPEGPFWVCDNGQITNSETSDRERELQNTIRSASIFLRECP